jgi:hypothetical protein
MFTRTMNVATVSAAVKLGLLPHIILRSSPIGDGFAVCFKN